MQTMLPKGKRISGLARGLWLGRDWITGGEERKRDKEKEMWMTLVLGSVFRLKSSTTIIYFCIGRKIYYFGQSSKTNQSKIKMTLTLNALPLTSRNNYCEEGFAQVL